MYKKQLNRILSLILTVCVCLTGILAVSAFPAEAKAAPKLSSKSVMIAMGGKQKITLKNGKGSWKVKSNGVVKISKKTKKYVTVKAVKAGTTTVTCKVGKKKLTCKVKVLNNSIGDPTKDMGRSLVVGKSGSMPYSLERGQSITDFVYDTKRGSVSNKSSVDSSGVTTGEMTVKAKKAGKFKVTINMRQGEQLGYDELELIFINGFRGKTKAKKTEANYKKWRKKIINSMVSADMSTWEIIDALGSLINTGKYGYKGGATGMQLWYGGNGTCVSGARMMNDFMKDLGITSKVHFAGKSKNATDIFGYTIMYNSQHKNTWITLGGKKWELNPQPESGWPIGIVKR